jgi:serine/threonine protein kinase, bacterial
VKQLQPANSDTSFLETARRLFNSEAETLERLGNHDQIPCLLAYFQENREFYLVQEFIEGHSLSQELLPGQHGEENKVIDLLQKVLTVLEFVHRHGVIHRDIKPDNLIRRKSDNKLVLVDFGAVKQVRTQVASTYGQVTNTVAIGTPGYMASEQAMGRPRPSSDIYGLGIIGIQALTGLMPMQFQDDINTGEILWEHIVPVSKRLAYILSRMVRYHFKDRYQSAGEALQALQQLIEDIPHKEIFLSPDNLHRHGIILPPPQNNVQWQCRHLPYLDNNP